MFSLLFLACSADLVIMKISWFFFPFRKFFTTILVKVILHQWFLWLFGYAKIGIIAVLLWNFFLWVYFYTSGGYLYLVFCLFTITLKKSINKSLRIYSCCYKGDILTNTDTCTGSRQRSSKDRSLTPKSGEKDHLTVHYWRLIITRIRKILFMKKGMIKSIVKGRN